MPATARRRSHRASESTAQSASAVSDGNKVYAAGDFSHIGVPIGPAAAFDTTTNEHDTAFPPIGNCGTGFAPVGAAVPDGAGGFYIGGCFTHVGGLARPGIAHLNANGAVDPTFNPQVEVSWVTDLELVGDKLYAATPTAMRANAGQPTEASRDGLAAFDAVTGVVDPNFDPRIETDGVHSEDEAVYTLAVAGGKVYAGGYFFKVNAGQPTEAQRDHLAAFDADTGVVDANFDAGLDRGMWSLAVGGGKLYAGGYFDMVNKGQATQRKRPALAAFDPASGVVDASFDAGIAGGDLRVDTLALAGGRLYAGGGFDVVNQGQATEAARRNMAAFDPSTGAVDPSFVPNVDALVRCLTVSAGKVYACGFFNVVNQGAATQATRHFVAAFDAASGQVDAGFDPDVDANVGTVAVSGGKAYISGPFSLRDWYDRENVAAFDATTLKVDLDFDPRVRIIAGHPLALVLGGGRLYVGGTFTTVNDGKATQATRNNLAAFELTNGTVVAGFDPNLNTDPIFNASVGQLAYADGKLYAGGTFTKVNQGQPTAETRNRIAAFDAGDRGSWTRTSTPISDDAAGAFFPPSVDTMALGAGKIYVGGHFETVNQGRDTEATRNNLAAFDLTDGDVIAGFDPNPNAPIFALELGGGKLYAGGPFALTSVNQGQATQAPRNRIAAFDPDTGVVDPDFDPNVDSSVGVLKLHGGKLYAGGGFQTVNQGQPTQARRMHLAAFDPGTGEVDQNFAPRARSPALRAGVRGRQAPRRGDLRLRG